ncbi:uncharacterized protein LOC128401050 [Podarcis raffonei]|uniref:uncharacterized protein LOC128401050 n=1 Tax=Podarcis raffonei TaxID=65483 RepID=UPI002329654C|nr:uncharacterized protein LOC128401050 [Podarcis raffonei]
MNLFWVLCALLANHWCLGDDNKDSELCTSTGELPAPDLFLNATLVPEGETITALCAAPSKVVVTRFFLCKDGTPVSFKKATSQCAQYLVSASPKNAGQYSCGYQQKDAKNQEKTSALSVAQNVIVQSGSNQKIIYGVVGVTILVLVLLIYLLVKKVQCRQRSSRQDGANTEHIPFDYVERNKVKNNSRNLASEEVQYATLTGLHQTVRSPPRNTETTTYASVTPLYKQPA